VAKRHLTAEQRALVLRLRAKGLTVKEIGEQLDCSMQTAYEMIPERPSDQPKSLAPPAGLEPAPPAPEGRPVRPVRLTRPRESS
jgi:hypothetical protein